MTTAEMKQWAGEAERLHALATSGTAGAEMAAAMAAATLRLRGVEYIGALLAERDAAIAARDALAGAVRSVGDLIADNGCGCDCGCAFSDGEHSSECDPCLACRVNNIVSPVRGTALDAALAAAGGGW